MCRRLIVNLMTGPERSVRRHERMKARRALALMEAQAGVEPAYPDLQTGTVYTSSHARNVFSRSDVGID